MLKISIVLVIFALCSIACSAPAEWSLLPDGAPALTCEGVGPITYQDGGCAPKIADAGSD